jgi:predicted ferric reductase
MTSVLGDPALTWYVTRATGLVLLVVLTVTTVLGVVSTVRPAGGKLPRFASTDLHRRLSLLGVALLLAHVLAAVLDSYVVITWLDAVVPFVGTYRPLWLGLGTLASDVLVVVVLSSLLRRRTSPRLWRSLHLTAYLAWPLMVVHGLGTGSDTRAAPTLVVTGACVAAVVAALVWRLVAGRRTAAAPGSRYRLAGLVVLPVSLLLLVGWLVQGPLAPGWSRRAGTPPAPSSTPVVTPGVAAADGSTR